MLNENKYGNKHCLRPWDFQRTVPSQVENVTEENSCLPVSVVRLFFLGVLRTAQGDKCFVYVLEFVFRSCTCPLWTPSQYLRFMQSFITK